MKAFFTRFSVWAGVVALSAGAAWADELVMPYACSVEAGQISLIPSQPLAYEVTGRRDEAPFSDCGLEPAGGARCRVLTVHKFDIACRGGRAGWADIAEAARRSGIALPQGLPPGYAPISALQGRLVLPALARFSAHTDAVTSEALSSPAVVPDDAGGAGGDAQGGTWRTVIKAEMRPEVPGAAMRVAGIIGVLLAVFLLAGLVAARQPEFVTPWPAPLQRLLGLQRQLLNRLRDAAASIFAWQSGPIDEPGDLSLVNALSIATARLAETGLLVATLPHALSLRGVLEGELDSVRARLDGIARGSRKRTAGKSAALVRTVVRDLERIARIAHGAVRDTGAAAAGAAAGDALDMPGCVQDAYRVLGINGDAAPYIAKKLVDALRMSWHPDFARDDDDRRLREARMKQINAAWDLIKNRPPQAA